MSIYEQHYYASLTAHQWSNSNPDRTLIKYEVLDMSDELANAEEQGWLNKYHGEHEEEAAVAFRDGTTDFEVDGNPEFVCSARYLKPELGLFLVRDFHRAERLSDPEDMDGMACMSLAEYTEDGASDEEVIKSYLSHFSGTFCPILVWSERKTDVEPFPVPWNAKMPQAVIDERRAAYKKFYSPAYVPFVKPNTGFIHAARKEEDMRAFIREAIDKKAAAEGFVPQCKEATGKMGE